MLDVTMKKVLIPGIIVYYVNLLGTLHFWVAYLMIVDMSFVRIVISSGFGGGT